MTRRASRLAPSAVAIAGLLTGRVAWAHDGEPHGAGFTAVDAWNLATASALVVAAVGYAIGLRRLRAQGARISGAAVVAYAAGLAAIAVALLSPLDAWSDVQFSAHMGQHELLVLFAAPLIVVGRPGRVTRAALPARARAALTVVLHRRAVARLGRIAGNRWVAAVLHGIMVWLWHVPALFEAALHDETIHALQHVSLFATSALFWWAMLRGRYGSLGYGLAVVFVFATALHKGLLGALFTVAERTAYPTHAARTDAVGADALGDQELAGLLMWVPAGLVTAALGVSLFVAWLGAIERRAAREPRGPREGP